MIALRRFFFGVTGVLFLIFLLQILLSGIGRAGQFPERTKPSSGSSEGSWYDEVGLGKGVSPVSGFSALDEDDSAGLEAQIAPASSACQLAALQSLGWTVERVTDSVSVNTTGGNPCDNTSLAESQSQGELRMRVPVSIDETSLSTALKSVLASQASVCAYKFRVGAAAQRASRKLQANEDFYFYGGGWPFISISDGSKWWGSCVSNGWYSCFYPRSTNSDTMETFYSGRIGTECALGLQAAEYSTLRELYGDAGFNTSFGPREILFAPWSVLNSSTSATWGNMTSADTTVDRDASVTSRIGPRAFSGFSGYIGNVFGEGSLDNPVDRGENFMTVSVSLRAGSQLASRGGFGDFNRLNQRIYELGLALPPNLEQLALTSVSADSIRMTDSQRRAFIELQATLANPLYSEYTVFVHPLGTMTLGQQIVRLLERNPRTPYTFALYPSKFGRGLYARYVNTLLRSCGR